MMRSPGCPRSPTASTAPWADCSVRVKRLRRRLLRERGTEVVMLPDAPGCSPQHYLRDVGFVIDDTLFAASAVRVNVLAIAPGIVGAARGGDCISAAMAPTGSTCLLSTTPR